MSDYQWAKITPSSTGLGPVLDIDGVVITAYRVLATGQISVHVSTDGADFYRDHDGEYPTLYVGLNDDDLYGEKSRGRIPMNEDELRRTVKQQMLLIEVQQGALDAAIRDLAALDKLNLLLSASEWPGGSGMEDVCEIVRATGRLEVPNAPRWERH